MTDFDFETLAIRAGQIRTGEGEHSEPIFTTSSYVFKSAQEAAQRFSGETPGNIYSRFTNPTVRTFEQRLAALEGGDSCVATASGMAAILSTCLGLLQAGDQVLCSRSVFGSTVKLFEGYLRKFGIDTVYLDPTDEAQWSAAITPKTKMLFVETPSNPVMELADISALAGIAHQADAILVVDNCFCTPALQQPLALGADIVVHSATKYLDGQGRCIGGAVVGDSKLVGEDVLGVIRTAGPSMSPFNAWVFLKGLETLSLRMEAHSRNALALAQWLEAQPTVQRVNFPGLPSHPQHELASRQQSDFGGIVSFEVADQAAAWRIIDSTEMLSITANLGDTKTTITHPASTTHSRLSDAERQAAGISDGLIRVAVGLESLHDIQTDLARGFSA
ncbi:MAG: O-succinylhomoserine sulfhydrylase [Thiotrichales bacterium]